jgi:acyl-CoA thioesterase
MTFSALLEGAEPRDSGFALAIPESWHQGRTAYGGLSAALAVSAARKVGGGALPPLRSAAISFVGPLAGPVEAAARKLRAGKNATWMSAEILSAGEVGLSASFVFMGPVPSTVHLRDCPAPGGLIAPQDAQVFGPNPHTPAFHKHHFEARFALPRAEGKQPDVCWWVRLKERDGLDPATELLLVADALPPGVLPLMSPTTRVSSMTWQANFLTATPRTRDGWWLLRSSADYAEAGCSSQIMRIWNADGEPMMAGMQSIAIFG